MKIVTSIGEMQALAVALRRDGKRIGFVPTMGFLHDGHLSLMGRARAECDAVVASIFVNPTQFGPGEDFTRYPRDEAGDRKKCEAAGVDILFLPGAAEMYAGTPPVFVTVDGISDILEGAIRPGHFRGVATVVAKLFNIVMPHRAYFGRKDFQQCAVIRRMTAGLNMTVEIIEMPTVREPDGLAMSSRNVYLDPEQRRRAACLYRALRTGGDLIQAGERDPERVRSAMREVLSAEPGVELDYAEAADADTLTPAVNLEGRIVLLVAARLGRTRLIDNLPVL